MMHNDGMSQLDLLVKRFSPPLLEVSRDSREEPLLAPGDRVQAHVLANLPNGRFHVLIKDQVLDMNLPPNTQTGDKLDLSVVRTQPRLTFAVTDDLQQAMRQSAPDVKLSDAVKYLGALLNRTAAEAEKSPAQLVRAAPLLPAGATQIDTGKLASNMQQQLSDSGVFFESHQAEWVTGQRSLQALMREPQAPFGSSETPQVEQQTRVLAQATLEKPAVLSAATERYQTGSELSSAQQPAKPEPIPLMTGDPVKAANDNQPGRTLPPAEHAQLRELVQQQLNCLDTRQLTWQGLAWPNQPLEWIVQEREERHEDGGAEQTVWYSRLHLDLPHLGAVTAAISLVDGKVKVHIQSSSATAELVRSNQGRLESQLSAAGMMLLGTTVDGDESR